MGLDVNQIRSKIIERPNGRTISKAARYQRRLQFHAQTDISARVVVPLTEFLAFVENLLPPAKFKTFKTLFRYPVKTNEVTKICFDKLSRIFDGRNPAFDYQFMDSEMRDDWEYYRKDVLGEPNIWSSKGWEFFKTEINSVLVVDLPKEQGEADRYPQPYFYWLPIESVLTYEADRTTGEMKWIIFRQDGGRIAVIDDERYRVFEARENNIGELITEAPHDLGYCPARFFWNTPLNLAEPDIKQSPLTDQLESLDWYLFFHISKRHLDLYANYPIYSGYVPNCNFSNEDGDYCDGGFLKNKAGYYKLDPAGILQPCPKCGNKRVIGPGTFVDIPIPEGDQKDLRNPVQMVGVDRASLDYNVSEEKRLKTEIITAVVGTSEQITAREALNEQQVKATFESQTDVLNRVKKGFEEAQKFVDSTICRLRYGDGFISATINYGTEFYVLSAAELREQYKTAKESGASEAELDALQDQIIATEYRNNPTQLQRMLMLAQLEPFRHLTRDEVLTLRDKGLISDETLRIKLNFSNFVRRFEREFTNVLEFGTQVPFDAKINIINKKFKDYASEDSTGD